MNKINVILMTSLLTCCGIVAAQTLPNTLSEREKSDGWILLFNGVNLDGWSSVGRQTPPERGWTVEDGAIIVNKGGRQRGGDIITKEMYSEFDFYFEFKLTRAANSGIKYFFTRYEEGGWLGNEYQVLDDDFHPDARAGRNGNRTTASLYDVLPPEGNKRMNPTGEWNIGRIVATGSEVRHYLNGERVLTYDRNSNSYAEAVRLSKFKDVQPGFGTVEKGYILLQDHDDEVWYRNIKIKNLSN